MAFLSTVVVEAFWTAGDTGSKIRMHWKQLGRYCDARGKGSMWPRASSLTLLLAIHIDTAHPTHPARVVRTTRDPMGTKMCETLS